MNGGGAQHFTLKQHQESKETLDGNKIHNDDNDIKNFSSILIIRAIELWN